MTERLLEWARAEVKRQHDECVQAQNPLGIYLHGPIFETCTYDLCVLVRGGAPAQRCEVCFGDLPENRCEKPAGHLDVHLVATGFVWRTMESDHEQQAPTVQSEAATAREVDSRSRVSGADALRSEAGVVTPKAAPAVLIEAKNLCESEANRWKTADPKTSAHWAAVAEQLEELRVWLALQQAHDATIA